MWVLVMEKKNWTCDFGHGNFLDMFWVMEIDELNFYVAKPQESRESPNVEKCVGSIIS